MKNMGRLAPLLPSVIALWVGGVVSPAYAQESVPAVELVRQTIENEVKIGADAPKFTFKKRKQTADKAETKLIVETRDANAELLVAVNDHPLDADQRSAEEERLRKLMNDPAELKKQQTKERDKSQHTQQIVKALPQAFLYDYDGMQPGWNGVGKSGEELVRLKFRPNPQYVPPTRVEQVLTGMEGYVLIDAKRHRLARINGTLSKEVAFGWGILGHLNPGGNFQVDVGDTGSSGWQISAMNLTFSGKIMMLKSLDVRIKESFSDYVPAPGDLSFAQGLELLRNHESQLALNDAKSGVH